MDNVRPQLTLDASSAAGCSVALQVGAEIFSKTHDASCQQARVLLPMIKTLCDEANITLSDLSVIGFACGPGSFTGIRIATSMAQGLAFGLNIPVVPISTLQALAQQAYFTYHAEVIDVVMNAHMGEFFHGRYRWDGETMQPIVDESMFATEAVAAQISADSLVIGNKKGDCQHLTPLLDARVMLPLLAIGTPIAPEHARPVYLRGKTAWC